MNNPKQHMRDVEYKTFPKRENHNPLDEDDTHFIKGAVLIFLSTALIICGVAWLLSTLLGG